MTTTLSDLRLAIRGLLRSPLFATVAILSLGTRLEEAEKAADQLDAMGLSTTVADLRFAKPLDSSLIRKLLTTHEVAVTVEEASIGGLGAHVLTLASDEGLVDAGLKIRTMRLPDRFQEHDKPDKQYDEAVADLESALTYEPRHFGAWIGLGMIFESIDRPEAALRAYEKALADYDVASKINPRTMAAIMAQMSPEAAERLTVELASRGNGADKAQNAADLPKIEGKPGGT